MKRFHPMSQAILCLLLHRRTATQRQDISAKLEAGRPTTEQPKPRIHNCKPAANRVELMPIEPMPCHLHELQLSELCSPPSLQLFWVDSGFGLPLRGTPTFAAAKGQKERDKGSLREISQGAESLKPPKPLNCGT